jgi:hypothetical protein
MSATTLLQQIRTCPYSDMMLIARELAKRLEEHKRDKLDAAVLAEAMNSLTDIKLPHIDAGSKQENEILQRVFKSQRSIKVTRLPGGYRLDISGSNGATVQNADLKVGLTQLIDTLLVAHALIGR